MTEPLVTEFTAVTDTVYLLNTLRPLRVAELEVPLVVTVIFCSLLMSQGPAYTAVTS